jgi:hypothetical protein
VDIVGFGVDALTREKQEVSLVLVAHPGNITLSLRLSSYLLSRLSRTLEIP